MRRSALEIGRALRQARKARDLTLRQVSTITSGRFKPTSVAGYERGERTISVERFIDLCDLYGVPPPAVLAKILRAVEGDVEPDIDLERLESLGSAEGALISGFVRQVSSLRREQPSGAIVLRAGDLSVLATAAGKEPSELVKVLRSGESERETADPTPMDHSPSPRS